MASDQDDVIQEWMTSFEALPKDRQENLRRWFATQKIIMDSAGLTEVEWFGYIQWAMDHPLDYSFIQDFPDIPEGAGASDETERSDGTRNARALVGGQLKQRAPGMEHKGMSEKGRSDRGLERELFDRFMRSRRT